MSVFLKFDGIDGESTDDRHKGEIEVTSWTFGMANSDTPQLGGVGARVGKVRFNNLTFVHRFDKSSPTLMMNMATGRRIPTATLTCRKAGEGQHDFLVVILKDVLVTSGDIQGTSEDGDVQERITLAFGRITVDYTYQQPDGSMVPAGQFGWDVTKNAPAVP